MAYSRTYGVAKTARKERTAQCSAILAYRCKVSRVEVGLAHTVMRVLNVLLIVPILFGVDCGGSVALDTTTSGGSVSSGGNVSTGGSQGVGGCCAESAASCSYGTFVGTSIYACPSGVTCHEETQYACGACPVSVWCAGIALAPAAGGSTGSVGVLSTGGSSSTGGAMPTSGTCWAGTLNCPCVINTAVHTNTCASGLLCNSSNVCIIGDSVATGGAYGTGGVSSIGGTTSTGGTAALGGAKSTSVNAGTGCTGSFEVIQSNTGLCVATMARIKGPESDAGSTDYSIDVTEVTKGQYDAWLATNPALPASDDANCGYLTSYAEQADGSRQYTGADADHHPVVGIDWCDAYKYCSGVGKRLCGAIGEGSIVYSSFKDANTSQWYRACSADGVNTYTVTHWREA